MLTITVPDMTCGHCASTITKAVKAIDSESRCEIDLAARQVRIESAQPAADFIDAIAEAGYTPAIAQQPGA